MKNQNLEKNQKVLNTEDYAVERMAAGTINSEGIKFVFMDIQTLKGEFGDFYRIIGIQNKGTKDEKPLAIDFSSSKLRTLIDKNFVALMGHPVTLSAHGDKFERNYTVVLD